MSLRRHPAANDREEAVEVPTTDHEAVENVDVPAVGLYANTLPRASAIGMK